MGVRRHQRPRESPPGYPKVHALRYTRERQMKSLVAEARHIARDEQTRKSAACAALLCPGVEERIENFSVLDDVFPEAPFESETGLFQHTRRCPIVRKWFGVNPV